MRLSTSTNIFFNRPGGRKASIIESISMCAQAGYKVMDMNFYDCTNFKLPFLTDEWEHWIHTIKEFSLEQGIEFSQAHSPFYNFCDSNTPNKEILDRMVMRSVSCAAVLGVKWLVIHAGTDFASPNPTRDSKKLNLDYLRPVAEFAAKLGVGLAIENLWDINISPHRRYTAFAEELVDLVDSFKIDNVGICWDFEHADIMQQDQVSALRLIGNRLKATHVSEQAGQHFDHLLPFSSQTDWKKIMPTLKEIAYTGDFTYEIHRYTSNIPDELVLAALQYSVLVGNHLLSLA